MRSHTLSPPIVAGHEVPAAARLFRGALNRFLVLPIAAVLALIWANTEPESYFRFSRALAFPVNEIAMAFFLALIAQELYEAMMPGGALAAWRHRWLPVIGGLGALVGSVAAYLIYVNLANEQVLATAWPVVAAVDVAAGYYVLRMLYPRRSTVVVFMLLMAVMVDVVALAAASLRSPEFTIHPAGFTLFIAALAAAAIMRRSRVKAFWPFWLVCGTLSWFAFYWMGIHPALSLVPIVPMLPHDRRAGDVFADRVDHNAVHQAEHEWSNVAQVALFLFGLVNAGVILKHVDTGTWAVMVAALIGRPAGVIAAIALAAAAGLHLPQRMHWGDVIVAALATTSGFTFGLFLAAAALPIGAVAEQVTLGVLLSGVGAGITVAAAWALSAGSFRPHPHH